ncbi:hypothetical protein VNO77_39417 [Canavalia gladiata]|uniref:Uncharacterized protein n=1 Tax=Canavalia gladiata TaxID=3824 RepID=A0AAN9KC43_CANGL
MAAHCGLPLSSRMIAPNLIPPGPNGPYQNLVLSIHGEVVANSVVAPVLYMSCWIVGSCTLAVQSPNGDWNQRTRDQL